MLHIRCGTDIVASLRAALPGEILVWQDPVCQGPTPAAWTGDAWYAGRAAFLAQAYGMDAAELEGELRGADAALDHLDRHDEVVLWLEHDLFDQAILLRLLTLIGDRLRGDVRLSLVSIASHPDVERFIGLGNLDTPQLAALFPGRAPITANMISLARNVWLEYVDPDPRPLSERARRALEGFPWLPAALQRHLEELPWLSDGLGRTERHALLAIAGGATTAGECFVRAQRMEEAPWLGDSMFYFTMAGLAERSQPLVEIRAQWPDPEFAAAGVRLTASGRRVLEGTERLVPEAERWVGGVRIEPGPAGWRWDPISRGPMLA